jgi:hypothetical protein
MNDFLVVQKFFTPSDQGLAVDHQDASFMHDLMFLISAVCRSGCEAFNLLLQDMIYKPTRHEVASYQW